MLGIYSFLFWSMDSMPRECCCSFTFFFVDLTASALAATLGQMLSHFLQSPCLHKSVFAFRTRLLPLYPPWCLCRIPPLLPWDLSSLGSQSWHSGSLHMEATIIDFAGTVDCLSSVALLLHASTLRASATTNSFKMLRAVGMQVVGRLGQIYMPTSGLDLAQV